MKLGIRAKLYRNTSGIFLSPTWEVIQHISDLSVNANWDEGEASTRASRIKKGAKTMMGLEFSGKVRVSNDDAGYIALWDAAHSDDVLDLLVLNGPLDENGVRGYRVECQVMSNTEDQALGNVLFMDFMLKPSPTSNEPKKAVVAAGAPVFSAVAE